MISSVSGISPYLAERNQTSTSKRWIVLSLFINVYVLSADVPQYILCAGNLNGAGKSALICVVQSGTSGIPNERKDANICLLFISKSGFLVLVQFKMTAIRVMDHTPPLE